MSVMHWLKTFASNLKAAHKSPGERGTRPRLRLETLEDRTLPAVGITEFPTGLSAGVTLNAIARGSDGNLWFTETNPIKVDRVTLAGVVTEFSSGITPNSGGAGIVPGSDGNLWFADGNRIDRVTTAGFVTEFPIPGVGGGLNRLALK